MKKILIVDDSTFMRNIIKDILVTQNNDKSFVADLEFCEADGKMNALKQLKKINPDAILLDIVMQESELEGIEFLEEIKPYFDLSKVIMISSIGHVEIIDKCKKLGVMFFVQKPIENEQLLDAVKFLLKQSVT